MNSDPNPAMPVDNEDSDPVRLKIEAMFDLLRRPADSTADPSADRTDETSEAWQRFRIVRSHAKGGLGEIWVAFDEQLKRDVALKEMQVRYASHPESRARFLREAEITGQLEHPGIVPVYTIGQHGDGRPFYAMRLITGDTLQHSIDRFHKEHGAGADPHKCQLELRKLLDRFIDVCNAISYAHSRGVIHRDLKPDNIMLGDFGETLVVDWGLAKPIGGRNDTDGRQNESGHASNGPAPTVVGATIGTPAYMSPEQAAGGTAELGPASDVYSLGATLYCLLIGKPPFPDSDVETVLAKVRKGDFPRPRQVNPAVPPPLEAVCLKAMSLDSKSRYGTVQAIADDLHHWLADEPVSVHPDSLSVSASRWGRRHKSIMTGASALALTAVFALIANNHLLRKEQERTEARRLQAVDAESRAVANQALAEANGRIARDNRDAAEENRELADMRAEQATKRFQLAADAYDVLVNRVQEELEHRAVSAEFRRELLQAARMGLERLTVDSDSTQAFDKTVVWSHLKMGDVKMALGDDLGARDEYDTAQRIANESLESNSNQPDLQRVVAACYERVGRNAYLTGRFADARDSQLNAIAIRRQLLNIEPTDLDRQRELAITCLALGSTYLCLREYDLAKEHFISGLERHMVVATARPSSWLAQRDLILSHLHLGKLERQLDHVDEAKAQFLTASEIGSRLIESDPANQTLLYDQYITWQYLGDIALEKGDLSGAGQWHRRSYDVAKRLSNSDPINFRHLREFATANERMGDVSLRAGNPKEATSYFEIEISSLEKVVNAGMNTPETRGNLAAAHSRFGVAFQFLGELDTARTHYQKAIAIADAEATNMPGSIEAQIQITDISANFGFCEMQALNYESAAKWFERAVLILSALKSKQNQYESRRSRASMERYADRLQFCRNVIRATDDLGFAAKQPPGLACELLGARSLILLRNGEHAASAETLERLAEIGMANPVHWYNAACGFALCSATVVKGRPLGELSAGESVLQESYATRAMEFLKRANDAGLFKNPESISNIKQNQQLNSLRSRPDFQEFVKRFDSPSP